MKKSLFALVLAFIFAITPISAFAATDLSAIAFDDESATPALSVTGYPRFEMLEDGTLALVNSTAIRFSNDNGATWSRKNMHTNAATEKTTASGTTHTLTLENWQPYVLEDGTIFVSYRARTKGYDESVGGEFYTSIRLMSSTDNGQTFDNEVILAEDVVDDAMLGFWEPFIIQIDDDTIALYYADDLNVNGTGDQNIVYLTYTISTGTWSTTPVVAINGVERSSRDGMAVVTPLRYGGFAMVVEAHDYDSNNSDYDCVFVIGLSFSEDGRTWSEPVPVAAPQNLNAHHRCSAPYITTLPDGRVVISYSTDDGYTGVSKDEDSTVRFTYVYGAIISDEVITTDTVLTPTTGGAAPGFTALEDVFTFSENEYMIWNTVEAVGDYLYFAGSSNFNADAGSGSVRIRRADITATVVDNDFDNDGETTLKDALLVFKGLFGTQELYKYDVNNDQDVTIADALLVLKGALD